MLFFVRFHDVSLGKKVVHKSVSFASFSAYIIGLSLSLLMSLLRISFIFSYLYLGTFF